MNLTKNILVSPLNWGLGHATRCVPIITNLIENGFNPIVASDGAALELLKKEFPNLTFVELPLLKVNYTEKGKYFMFQMLKLLPHLIKNYFLEKRITRELIKKYNLLGIISDNRPGVYSKSIPSVYVTHQVNVLSGRFTCFVSKLHQYFIKKYDECWIPDSSNEGNLTGEMSNSTLNNLKYIGPISRLKEIENSVNIYDVIVILSGPEPQRTQLETILLNEFENFKGKIVFVRGTNSSVEFVSNNLNIDMKNVLKSNELELLISQSKIVICRSGYTSIMDLAALKKKCILIPTPGQSEQIYLAKRLKKLGSVYSCKQHKFTIDKLVNTELYQGFRTYNFEKNWKELFALFQSK